MQHPLFKLLKHFAYRVSSCIFVLIKFAKIPQYLAEINLRTNCAQFAYNCEQFRAKKKLF